MLKVVPLNYNCKFKLNPNTLFTDGHTPLTYCIAHDLYQCWNALRTMPLRASQRCIDVNKHATRGLCLTPLHYAIHYNRMLCMHSLLACNASMTTVTADNCTVLVYALIKKRKDIAKFLIDTAKATEIADGESTYTQIKKYMAIDTQDSSGMTALMYASKFGYNTLIEDIAGQAADPSYYVHAHGDLYGMRALNLATHFGHGKCVSELCRLFSDHSATDMKGRSSLINVILPYTPDGETAKINLTSITALLKHPVGNSAAPNVNLRYPN